MVNNDQAAMDLLHTMARVIHISILHELLNMGLVINRVMDIAVAAAAVGAAAAMIIGGVVMASHPQHTTISFKPLAVRLLFTAFFSGFGMARRLHQEKPPPIICGKYHKQLKLWDNVK